MADERKRIVQAGYDAIAERFLAWIDDIEGDPRLRFLDEFMRRLPDGACVLDLGCGAGVPCTKLLAKRFQVTGVDVSQAQLCLARNLVPGIELVHADMTELQFPEAMFDGITAFYCVSHVPREEQGALYRRVAGWLTPGGLFLASLGIGDSDPWVGGWLGVPMFFSSFDPDTNRRLLAQAGLTLFIDEVVTMREPEGEATFQWVLARKR